MVWLIVLVLSSGKPEYKGEPMPFKSLSECEEISNVVDEHKDLASFCVIINPKAFPEKIKNVTP